MATHQKHEALLRRLIEDSSPAIDLRKKEDLSEIEHTADTLVQNLSGEALASIEASYSSDPAIPLAFKIAIKLAKSKNYIGQFDEQAHVSVVIALYKEHNRIKPPSQHPHGEDFLRVKVHQLNWLFEDAPNYSWDLTLVDDGCPNGSGEIAREIVSEAGYRNVDVLFLADAIKEGAPVAAELDDPSDSQKGGSILYGMYHASREDKENHVVLYTDADLSTHLGQVGLLTKPILEEGFLAAIGSRREEHSVVIKKSARNDRGKLFIYSWKRMLPELGHITDTQCGFKAFAGTIVQDIVAPSFEKKFAFDIELLLKTENIKSKSIHRVPVAWIDSEAESTTTDIQPYLPMLKSISQMYSEYSVSNAQSDEFSRFFDTIDKDKWQSILENIPEEITSRNPAEFSIYDKIKTSDLVG